MCDRDWCAPDDLCWRCMVAARNAEAEARVEAEQAAETARLAAQRDWFTRTGHCGQCGQCGQPAGYCVCTDTQPCACRVLHRVGDGLDPDALTRFADAPATDQGELFA